MSQPEVRQPTAEHPITVAATDGHVTVRVRGQVVAETDAALSLKESTYPVVQYVPLASVDGSVLRRSDTKTYCPYKGEASYYHLGIGDQTVDDAVWTYEHPYPAVAQIAGHVAFYPDKADVAVS